MRKSQSTAELQVGGRPQAIGPPVSDNGRQSEAAVAQTRKKGASLKLPGGGLTIFSFFYQRRFDRLSQHSSTLGGKALWESREASHALTLPLPPPPHRRLRCSCAMDTGGASSLPSRPSGARQGVTISFIFFSISRPRHVHEALLK
jgi:hypothetical protein